MLRRFSLLLLATIAGVAMGLINTPTSGRYQPTALPVLAQGCLHGINAVCNPADATKTSAMTVRYVDGASASVIPNGATNWTITAHWYPNGGAPDCTIFSASTCTVTWNGTSWALSNVALGAGVAGIALCDTSMCDYEAAVGYKLIVSIADPLALVNNLDNVDYVTTAVPNGTVCGGSNTTPVSQTNSGNQYISTSNSNICPFTCSVNGGSMTITYN